jgi:hypothetical protein
MNIDRCDQLCETDFGGPATVTPAGIELLRQALELLGHPEVVTYVDIADALTPKDEHGKPIHEEGHLKYLAAGTDITCPCVLCAAMRECGYADIGGEYRH